MLPIENFQEMMIPFARPAWVPQTEVRQTSLLESKYGGIPWMASNETWPLCSICRKQPLQFVLQLNLESLPEAMRKRTGSKDLIQFFYSSDDCFPVRESDEPDMSPLALVRLVEPDAPNVEMAKTGPTNDRIVERAITGWKEWLEYPHLEDRHRLGISVKSKSPEDNALLALSELDFDLEREIVANSEKGQLALTNLAKTLGVPTLSKDVFEKWRPLARPLSGDKLGGWPWWAKGSERQLCAVCEKPCELIYQLNASESFTDPWTTAYAPGLFASDGTGHISQCPIHPDQMKFHWSSG